MVGQIFSDRSGTDGTNGTDLKGDFEKFSWEKNSRRFFKHLSYLSHLSYFPFFPFILLSVELKSRLYGTDVGDRCGTDVR